MDKSDKKETYSTSVSVSGGEFTDVHENVITSVMSPGGKQIEINDKNADDAMKYATESKSIVLDPVYEKKLLRKIDWLILPVIVSLMSCQLMDKTTNSYAAIMGLRTDLHMSTDVYSWVGSSFYFGYLFFEYPCNVLLQKFPLSKILSTAVILWGIILMCHAACQSAAPFLVCRVLLGAFEGCMNPAYIMLTSQWWKKSEQFMRTCIWMGFQGFGTILGAGIAYGLAVNRGEEGHALASWRLLYIITGAITVFLGFISLVHMPDIPTKAWFLNKTDKMYAVERIRENQQGFGNHQFKKHQMMEAFSDPVTWILFIYGMSYAIPNGGFNNFGSTLLNSDFGFLSTTSLLMNMPGGAIDVVIPFAMAYLNYKFMNNKRLYTCIGVNIVCLVGMCLLNFTSHKGSKLAGYLSFYFATGCLAGVTSIISSNVAGYTKKTVVNTMFLIGYCAGNIIGPQTFKAEQAPSYEGAKAAMLVSFIGGTICMIGLVCIYVSRNKSRDKQRLDMGDAYVIPENIEFADLTDKENPEFRYSL